MNCGQIPSKLRAAIARAFAASAIVGLTLNPALTPAIAADEHADAPVVSAGSSKVRFLSLGIGKSIVIDFPQDVKDVLVADPKIANAVVRSARRAYIIGAAVGQTNVVFFDADGQQVAGYDIAIKRDLNGVRQALSQSVPGVKIDGVGDGVILTGSVASPVEAQQAGDIAARLVGGADKVVNSIVVRGRDQVMLKVNVAEVRREIVKQLGIDLSASMTYGTAVVNFNNSNPFTAYGKSLVNGNGLNVAGGGLSSVSATMRAMETAGVIRTLAEPNLTAISGESATFIAGGEFPVPGGYSCDPTTRVCTTQITYKKFGISLNFTPVVLSEGRISLRVMTEVSELSNDNAITVSYALTPSLDLLGDDPRAPHPPRRDDAGDSLRRLDGDGRPDPAADQAGHQRPARSRSAADPRPAVPQPGLRQQRDRADGDGDALCGARRRPEGTVAARRRLRAGHRRAVGAARPHEPPLRHRRADRAGLRPHRRFRLHHRLRLTA
jgi:pilus assembly protein CpaC